MTVKQLREVSREPFKVCVKEPGKCFDYKCWSHNKTQQSDFDSREVYEVDMSLNTVRCW